MKSAILFLFLATSFIKANLADDPKIVRGKFVVPPDSVSNNSRFGRIFNGQQAGNGQFPWVVQMNFRTKTGGHFCSGSLISDNYVVAARHCIADTDTVTLEILLGSVDRNTPEARIFSDQFVWMSVNTGDHPDIAIFRLAKKVQLSSNIRPIALPPRSYVDRSFTNDLVTVAGFGGTQNGWPQFLQYTQLKVLSNDECNRYFTGNYINSERLCAFGYPDHKQSICGGDSGTGLVYYESGRPMLVGVASILLVGADGCNSGGAQGFVRVSKFLNFISDVTGIQIA